MTRCYCKGAVCGNAEIPKGARTVHIDAAVDWGVDDIRENWSGSYDFGSFACMALWAQDTGGHHDGHTLSEGKAA